MKNLWTVFFVALFLVRFAAPAFAGGTAEGGEQRETVEITVLLAASDVGADVLEIYNEMYPHVRVNAEQHNWEKLGAMVTSGDIPAVTAMTQTRVARFAAIGAIAPIDDLVERYSEIEVSDFMPSEEGWILDENFLAGNGGSRYGISKDWNLTEDFFYRRDIFAEAGVAEPAENELLTYAEFREMLEQLAVRENDVTRRWAVDGYLFADVTAAFRTLLYTAGTDVYNGEMTRVDISGNDEALRVLRFLLDLQRDYLAPSVIDPAPVWALPLMNNIEESPLAIMQWGQWALSSILEEPEELIENVAFAEGPVWSTQVEVQLFHPSVGYSIGAGLTPEQEEAAWDFLELLTYGEVGRYRAEQGWGFPAFRSMMELAPRDNALADQVWRVSMHQIENQQFDVLGWTPYASFPLQTAINANRDAYLRDEISFDEFVRIVETEANEALRRGIEALAAE